MHYLGSITGVPSITSIVLLLDLVLERAGRPLLFTTERRVLLWIVAVTSLVLYPSALGFTSLDVYRFGFSPAAPLGIAFLGIAAAVRREIRLALLTLVILLSLDLRLLPSVNAFDYAIDPIVGLLAILWASVRMMTIITHA
ncbi:MAG TPA: hypothetical protein VLV78_01575 [Thermoanaerobaculia bacterium]|nr:hypothetical protein [Thermoanaerobaculia bacterium]